MRTAIAITLAALALGAAGCSDDEGGTRGPAPADTGTAPADRPAGADDLAPSDGGNVAPEEGAGEAP